MERIDIMNKLHEIIREAVDDDELVISDETKATDVEGWDSLAQVLIVGEIQNELGVKFTSAEINGLANVGELIDAISAKM